MKRINFASIMLENKLCYSEDEDCLLYLLKHTEGDTPTNHWHKDISRPLKLKKGQTWTGNISQIILYMGGNFTGGLLETKKETIKPITNRLVILNPQVDEHRVTPVTGNRYCITGFLYKF